MFFSGFRSYRGDAIAAVAGARGGSGGPAVNGDCGERSSGEGEGSKLAFHHFPIPDLSPAENVEMMSALVEDLEHLVVSGKVGSMCADSW